MTATDALPTCASCGREMAPRKRWTSRDVQPKYCSAACRRQRVTRADRELETRILELLDRRQRGASICPSEVARAMAPEEDAWRALMEPVRRAARRLVANDRLVILQKGRIVDPSSARGPIRLALPRS